jgi:O-antigen ligase
VILPWAIAVVLAGALLLGGANAQGGIGDPIAILVSVPLLAWSVYVHISSRDGQRAALLLAALTLALPLAQILTWSGAHDPFAAVHAAWQVDWVRVFGATPPATWSLAPDATVRTLFSFIPPLAVFLAVLALDARGRRTLHHILVGLIVFCAVWGILQAVLGPRLVASWHSPPVGEHARGFFSNRNHFATLMVFGIALAGAGLIAAIRRMVADVEMARHGPVVILWTMLLLLPLVGLMLSVSRAGVVLGGMVLIALLALTLFGIGRDTRGTRRWFVSLSVFGCVVAVQMGLWGVLARFEVDPFDDARVYVQRITLDAAEDAQPWGTGLGTFRRVYEQREPLDTVLDVYVNRAHNDWIEFYLEAGKPGLALIALWLGWWAWRMARGMRDPAPHGPGATAARLLRAAAVFALAALAIHSLVDFPMRTIAIATVAGALLALTVRPVRSADEESRAPRIRDPHPRSGRRLVLMQ